MAQYNLSHTGQQLDAAVEKYLQTDFNSFVSDSDLNTTLTNYIPLKTPTNTGVFLRGDNTWSNILNTSEAGITGDTTASIRLKVIHQETGVQCGVSIAASGSNHGVWSNGYSDGTTFTDSASWIIFRNNRGELIVPHDLYVYGEVLQSTKIYTRVYYSGSGDVQFTGWIPFNTTVENVGGGTWSSGAYCVPEDGYYFCSFTCFSNQPTEGRTAIAKINSSYNSILQQDMCNGNTTTSISSIFNCSKGEYLVAGAYHSNYPIRFYAASGHNAFTIMKIL